MTGWDIQKFDFRSFSFSEMDNLLTVHGLALTGHQDTEEWKPETPIDLAGSGYSLKLYDTLEDKTVDEWSTLSLDFEVDGVSDVGDEIWIQVICEDTRLELARQVTSVGREKLDIPVGNLRRKMQTRLLATSAESGSRGLVVGSSPIFEVVLDRPALLPGGGLRFEWNKDRFEDLPQALFLIEHRAQASPVIYLNQTIRGFEPALSSHRGGAVGAMRRFLLTLIEARVRLELLRTVALGAEQIFSGDFDAVTDEELENELSEVELQMLRMGVETLGDGDSPDPLTDLLRRLSSDQDYEWIRARLEGVGSSLGTDLSALIGKMEQRGS